MQPGDVLETSASVERLATATGFCPDTPIQIGIGYFIDWYRSFYGH
jgi:UDP-glucuronate 4-epimerase